MKTLRFIFLFATLFLFLQAGSFAQKLPNIHILATGGTIAGTGTSTTGSSTGRSGCDQRINFGGTRIERNR